MSTSNLRAKLPLSHSHLNNLHGPCTIYSQVGHPVLLRSPMQTDLPVYAQSKQNEQILPRMDILKKAANNPNACRIEGTDVHVGGKSYPGDMTVSFPSKKQKSYSLSSAVFYLMHTATPLMTYISLCQQAGIPPVGYLDQLSLKEDVAQYEDMKVPGVFLQPVYTHHKAYDIPCISDMYYIVVPSDVSCPININNASQLLAPAGSRAAALPVFEIDGQTFWVRDNPKELKDGDWKKVKSVFLDGTIQQLEGWEDKFYAIRKKAAIFSVVDCPYQRTNLHFKDDKIENLDEIYSTINECLNR